MWLVALTPKPSLHCCSMQQIIEMIEAFTSKAFAEGPSSVEDQLLSTRDSASGDAASRMFHLLLPRSRYMQSHDMAALWGHTLRKLMFRVVVRKDSSGEEPQSMSPNKEMKLPG